MIGAHRVLLLVQGTEDSNLDPFGPSVQSLTDQSVRVTSRSVRCLLSATETYLDLHGYCNFNEMLIYRLDKETVMVLVSAVAIGAGTHSIVATVEHMRKLGEQEKAAALQSFAEEWSGALTPASDGEAHAFTSPKKAEYWSEERTPKVRRIQSEPQSPKPSALGSAGAGK